MRMTIPFGKRERFGSVKEVRAALKGGREEPQREPGKCPREALLEHEKRAQESDDQRQHRRQPQQWKLSSERVAQQARAQESSG